MNPLLFCLFLLLLIVWPYVATPLHPDAAEEEEGAKVTPPDVIEVSGKIEVRRK